MSAGPPRPAPGDPGPGSFVRVLCPAKVNLFLEVLARRPDGFHEIETVFTTIALFDDLLLSRAVDGISLAVTGGDGIPADEQNLVHRAATAFASEFLAAESGPSGVRIHLTKRIPAMAGLGGGSSDAAGALRGLRDLFRPDLPTADLLPLAATLGSDVPFFLSAGRSGGAALGTGRGEVISSLPAPPPFWLVLLDPGFGLSTPEVYRAAAVPDPGDMRSAARIRSDLAEGRIAPASLFNRLEEAAGRVEPRIPAFRRAVEALLGPAERMLMTGSGSAFFVPAANVGRASALAAAVNRAEIGRALAVKAPAPSEP